MSEATEILAQASAIVSGGRQRAYGPPERNLARIAALWSAYLDRGVSAADVAALMILLKVGRAQSGAGTPDNAIDAAGYAALWGEMLGGTR